MKADTPASNDFNQNRYWLLWVLGTAGGWLTAYWVSILIGSLVLSSLPIDPATLSSSEPLPEAVQMPLLFLQVATLFIIGAIVGGAQWLLLRQQIPQVGRWPLFTALGCLITLFAGPYWLLFVGLGMGLLQWLILRNILNRSGWWSLISAGGWALGFVLGDVVGLLLSSVLDVTLAQLLGYTTIGIVAGALTGVVLLWLLRENRVLLDGLREEAEQAKR